MGVEKAVVDMHPGAIRQADEAVVRRTVVALAGDVVGDAADLHVGAGDVDVAVMVVVLAFGLIGDGGEVPAGEGQGLLVDGIGHEAGDLLIIERQGRGQPAGVIQHKDIRAGVAIVLIQSLADVIPVVGVFHRHKQVAAVRIGQGGLSIHHGGYRQRQGLHGGGHVKDGRSNVLTPHIVHEETGSCPVHRGLHGGGEVFGRQVVGGSGLGFHG